MAGRGAATSAAADGRQANEGAWARNSADPGCVSRRAQPRPPATRDPRWRLRASTRAGVADHGVRNTGIDPHRLARTGGRITGAATGVQRSAPAARFWVTGTLATRRTVTVGSHDGHAHATDFALDTGLGRGRRPR